MQHLWLSFQKKTWNTHALVFTSCLWSPNLKTKTFSIRSEVFFIFLISLITLYIFNNAALITIQVTKLHEQQEMLIRQQTHAELNSTTQGLHKTWIFCSSNLLLTSSAHCSALESTKGRKDLLTVSVLRPDSPRWSSIKLKFYWRPIACSVFFEALTPFSHGGHSLVENELKHAASLARKRSVGKWGGHRGSSYRSDPHWSSHWRPSPWELHQLIIFPETD